MLRLRRGRAGPARTGRSGSLGAEGRCVAYARGAGASRFVVAVNDGESDGALEVPLGGRAGSEARLVPLPGRAGRLREDRGRRS